MRRKRKYLEVTICERVLTRVESGKCRRVTAAIDVIVTLCRKSVGKRVCNVLRFSLADGNFEL